LLFNSFAFFLFFVVVYVLYLLLAKLFTRKKVKLQNLLLLVASYIFYGSWDWRFLSLIAISTLSDFVIGKSLGEVSDLTPAGRSRRKMLLACSVVVNLTILGFFKYFRFFAASAIDLLRLMGMRVNPLTLNVILPVGISFYTFQTMSYTVDVYRRRLQPTHSLLDFAVFVAFFPQLVAGPIERAANLLPQFARPRHIRVEQVSAGLFLILWGFYKKVVIADNVALIADQIFNHYTEYAGLDILLGVLAFSIQIYGDFAGYSDIARGLSRLMGFELLVNFRLPIFAVNPSDFWSRWHISLSSWLRDYLYIPLGGNRGGAWKTYRNLLITMILGGLWHGAAWNFVIWGAYHGLILVLYRAFERRPVHRDPWGGEHPYVIVILKMGIMFILTLVGWLIFRSTCVRQMIYMLTRVSLVPSAESMDFAFRLSFFALPLLLMQIYQYVKRDLLTLTKLPALSRVLVYGFFLTWILIFGVRGSTEFIYFQF